MVIQNAWNKSGGWGGKGMMMQMWNGGWGGGKGWGKQQQGTQCMKHGKRRSMEALEKDPSGGYVCKADSLCQMKPGDNEAECQRGLCSKHGKTRSMDCLADDGAGGVCCTEEKSCRTGGEGWGGGAKRGGPDLARTRLSEELVTGTVLEWKGKFGWIQPAAPIEHALASKNGGKVYVALKDLVGATELTVGATIGFKVYADSSGLGAEDLELSS
mmetsp:Transcript_74012/g.199518  ORF Transcript_74012/g.199518 Transcript_74012/m.199518 type:complete len:214 (+) Transcript_74012:114-755(+)